MTSSLRAKMVQVIKEEKIASRKREESANDKLQHQQASVGGVSAKASSSDSTGGVEKVRARTEKGHFVKDDPNTPENEAWVEKPKKAPAKKKAPVKKKASKKS